MKAKLINKALAWLMTLTMVVSMLPASVFAAGGNVAKVGDTEYATIDEAIANWTNGTTLTLLADVTLSDVIKLNSQEHHYLELGTYTMTAVSAKDAIEIKSYGRGDRNESGALTITADSANPGGINAGSKACITYKYDSTLAGDKYDRPIVYIKGGVFDGASYGGIKATGHNSAQDKCATFNISGGTFNCGLNLTKAKLLISGGTFNASVNCTGGSTSLRLISGGAFKSFGFMTADASSKFGVGTALNTYDVGAYIDDNGYLVVGGPVVTEAGETFEASSANYGGFSNYLQYSSVKDNGLYYTSVEEAFADNNTTAGSVTVYVDELDMTGINFKGTIVAPEGKTLTITNAPDGLKTEGNVVVVRPAVKIDDAEFATLAEALAAAAQMTGDVTVEIFDKVTMNANLTGSFDSITFIGKEADAEIYMDIQGAVYATGKTVAFEDLTLSKVAGGYVADAGFRNVAFGLYAADEVTYTNCTFLNGAYASGKDTFTGCTFYRSHDRYGLWVYGANTANTVLVDGCTFADFRGIKLFSEGNLCIGDLTVKNTNFTAVNDKPAIVLTSGKSVTLEGNTYSSTGVFELDLDGVPNGTPVASDVAPTCINDDGACGVLVDGEIYTTVAQAKEVAVAGSEVTLLHESTETVEFAEGVNLNKNGFTAAGVTVKQSAHPVAQVGEAKYTDLQEAIKAAAPAGTVTLLSDVTVDEWKMVTEKTIATGQLTTLVIDGMTIDGNGKTLTIKDIESASNGGYLFDGARKLTVQDLTIKYADGLVGGIGLKSGTISNVTFDGGKYGVLPGTNGVTVTGCTFNNIATNAIYLDEARNGIVITGNTFNTASGAYAVILYADEQFTNNTVISGKVNAANSAAGTISGNDFGTERFKVYNAATAKIENNTINNLVFNDGTATQATFNNNTLSDAAAAALAAVQPKAAKIGEQTYATLEEAFAAAQAGETITLLADASPALTSQRAITKASVIDLGGKTLTLTEDDLYFGTTTFKNGTIVVDPSVKPSTAVFWMFAGQTLTFDAVKLVATGVSGTYLIGLEGDNSNLNILNGSEIVVDNTTALDLDIICVNSTGDNYIVVDDSKVNVTNLDGRVFFRGNYTIKGNSDIDLSGITKAGFRIEAGQTLSIEDTATVDIVGEPRDGGIHLTDLTATYTKADTATVNATINAPAPAYVAEVNGVGYETLSAAFAAVTADDQTVVILGDVTENLTAPLRGNITTKDGAKVTINLTNTDWVYLNYTFVVGENVTLKAPALFYYAGGAQIKGTVITDAYYQRYAGTKLTINEPGSLTVNTEMFYLRYMDSDPNAGIYVVGDNDDSTVGLNLSVAYFYQGMINAKDATIKTAVYWQTNETDGTGSANLVLDNTKMTVTGSELDSAATGNSTVTLTNGSILTCAGNFVTGDNTAVSVDATSKIIARGQVLEFGLSGSGTEADPFVIASVDDLILFRDSVNAGDTKYNAEGVYVALGADIDLAGENWVGIGSIAQPHGFMGNFDGKGFKVKNLTITNPALDSDGYAYAGLFSITEGTDKDNQNVIKNLTIENVTISTTGHIVSAAIAYPYYTIVDNVTVCGDINIIGGNYTAGALAYTRRCVNASNVTVSGSVGSAITGAQVVGGVISDIQMNGGLTAAYSNFHAEGLTINGTKNVGGISGIIASQTLDGATVKNVVINGADTRVGIVSGVLGGVSTIKNVVSESVTGATAIIGGTYDAGAAVEAKIGNTYYATLDDALVAAQTGETIELLAPIVVAAGESLTLDKAVTITYTSNVPGEDMITNRGTLVIDGATLVYTNNDTTGSNVTVSTISSAPGSVLTVNSGVVKNDSANNSKGGAGSFAYAIDLLTNGGLGDVTATINGGEVISTNYMAIRQFVNGETCKNTLTVNGGIIQGATRGINIQLQNNMAYTTINGGTIKGGDYALCFLTTSENLSVTGGEFKGEVWYSGTDGFITGGTFDSDVTDYCAEGYTCKQNADGTYGIVEAATELFTLAGITTSLDSSLALNIYYTPLSGVTATDYYAVVAHQKEDTVEETTIPYADWGTSGSKKLVRYTGLAAKEMADELTVTIYDANGNAVSKSYTTSFRAYAIGMMSSGQYDPIKHRVWFTALTDMLNYGAAAQQMFGYKTDNLANAGTDAFQQYASTEYTLSTDGFSMSGTAWAPSLTLESTILLNFYFNDVTEGMYATYAYTTHAGTPVSATVDYGSFVSGWGHYGVAVPIAIADAGTPVTVTMFHADGSVAGTMTCSANNYLKGMAENDPDAALYPALAKFATSAKEAFAN